MTPDVIKSHAQRMRKTVERLRQQFGTSHPAVKEGFGLADDLCELVIALAENQQQWLSDQQAQHGDPK